MQLSVVNGQNEKVGDLELKDEIFGGRVKTDLVWAAVVQENASERRGTHATGPANASVVERICAGSCATNETSAPRARAQRPSSAGKRAFAA